MSWTRPVYGLAAVAFAATVALATEPAPIGGGGPYPPMQPAQFQPPAGVPGPYPYIPNAPVIGPAPGQPGGLPTRMLAPQVPSAPQLPQFAPPQAPFIPPSPEEQKKPGDQPQPGAPNDQPPAGPGGPVPPGTPGDPKGPILPPGCGGPPTPGVPMIKHWIPPAPGPDGTLQVCPLAPVPCMVGSSIDYFYRPLLTVNRTFGVTPIGTVAPTAGATGIPQGVVTQTIPTPAGTSAVGGTPQTVILVPDYKRLGMRIADNESPQPQDRVFFNYHYFQGVASDLNPNPLAVFRQPDGTLLQSGAGQTVAVPIGGVQQRVMYGTLGLEKTLPNNPNVSFGVRVPVYNAANGAGFTDPVSTTDVGDITGIFKIAAINDPCTGTVLSTGVAVTVPIGERTIAYNGDKLDSVMVQPYVGFLWECERCFYIQGFSSASLPIDGPEPILLFNDLGIGWWAYESNWFWLQGIIPTLEAHVTTPVEQRGDNGRSTRVFDSIVGTAGVHFLCGCGSTFTIGGSSPFTGPRPFDYELFAQINFRF